MGEGSVASRIRSLYPSSADASAVSLPTALVSAERLPPPHPLLQKEYARLGAAGAVRAEPPAVHFAGIDESSGVALTQTIRLLNVGGEPVRMHVLPPSTPYFSMALEKRGRVMPGLAEEVTIRFTPDAPRYYHDTLKVHLGDEPDDCLLVPLHGYPAIGELAVPPTLDFGRVAQGDSVRRIVPLRSPDGAAFDFEFATLAPHPDFEVSPAVGVVPARGEVSVAITYTPSRMATARAVVEVRVAQLNLAPRTLELVGSSAPIMVKERALRAMLAPRAGDASADSYRGGYDDGDDNGYGDGHGEGYGDGHGDGYGDGHGDGHGDGQRDGHGDGDGQERRGRRRGRGGEARPRGAADRRRRARRAPRRVPPPRRRPARAVMPTGSDALPAGSDVRPCPQSAGRQGSCKPLTKARWATINEHAGSEMGDDDRG